MKKFKIVHKEFPASTSTRRSMADYASDLVTGLNKTITSCGWTSKADAEMVLLRNTHFEQRHAYGLRIVESI